MADTWTPAGTAPIKAEYLISREPRPPADDDAAEGATSHVHARPAAPPGPDTASAANGDDGVDGGKKPSAGAQRRKQEKEDRKKQKGANKGRRWTKVHDDLNLCWRVAAGQPCEFGAEQCRFTHDVGAYLAQKQRDIRFPAASALSAYPPFVDLPPPPPPAEDGATPAQDASIDCGTICPVFAETGECRHGLKCRFLGAHVRTGESGAIEPLLDADRAAHAAVASKELNFAGPEVLKLLRTKKFPRPISDAYLKELREQQEQLERQGVKADEKVDEDETLPAEDGASSVVVVSEPEQLPEQPMDEDAPPAEGPTEPEALQSLTKAGTPHAQEDTPDVPMRAVEKKRLHWEGKTYLAPLTTVGNLPFRRLCVTLGADITCGEMGLATSFLTGSKEEWSLVRRHPSERTFGVQLAGSKPAMLVPAAEAIARVCGGDGGLDFVDLNCGCPIDLVFRKGAGSALLDAAGRLAKSLVGMSRALGEIPLTVKLRTGVKDGHNNAHRLMPRILDWDVSMMTLHGRTRQQRYVKLADWAYIRQCVEAVREREAEEGLPRIPIFGGGDAFSAADYWEKVDASGVDGCMIARGALIKPWIFTEIKERREWDISARERLELIRNYAEYGLSHFGTDTAGVNTTRRYLCEALSFQHRYVPVGLLERLPGRINDRAPAFRGRDELETLLASDDSRDWVRVSEMFLGPAPERWSFTPKHKSNAVETQG